MGAGPRPRARPAAYALLALLAALAGGPGCVTLFVQGSLEPDTHELGGFERAWVIDRPGDPDGDLLVVQMSGYQLREAARVPFTCGGWNPQPAEATFLLDEASGRAVLAGAPLPAPGSTAGAGAAEGQRAPIAGAVEVPVIAAAAPTRASAFVVQGTEEPLLFHEGRVFVVSTSHQDLAPLQRTAQAVALPLCVAADVALVPAYAVAAGVIWLID